MKKQQRENTHHWPLLEYMPALGDEPVWDLLEMLHGLIDAYEELFEEVVQGLRHQRYQELHVP